MKTKVGSTWESGRAWVKVGSTWHKGIAAWVNVQGVWKRMAYGATHVYLYTQLREVKTGVLREDYEWTSESESAYSMKPSDYPLAKVAPVGRKQGTAYRAGLLGLYYDETTEGREECARFKDAFNKGKVAVTVTNPATPSINFTMSSDNTLLYDATDTALQLRSQTASKVAKIYESVGHLAMVQFDINYKE